MSKIKMSRSNKRAMLNPKRCKLCQKDTNSIHINGFCTCIVEPINYEPCLVSGPLGSIVRVQKIKEEDKALLRSKYQRMSGETNTPLKMIVPRKEIARSLEKTSRAKKKKFFDSWEWKEVRYEVLVKFGARCMLCGATAKDTKIHVDHIKPISKFWELRLQMSNLQVLCQSCNMGKGNHSADDFR